MEYMEL